MTLETITRRSFLNTVGAFLFAPKLAPLFQEQPSPLPVADALTLLESLRKEITAARTAELTKYGQLVLKGDETGTWASLVERALGMSGVQYAGNVTDVVIHAAVDPALRARIALITDAELLLNGYENAISRGRDYNKGALALSELERATLETQLDSFHRLLEPVDAGLKRVATAHLPIDAADKEDYRAILRKGLKGKAYEDAVAVINRRLKDRINTALHQSGETDYALTDNTRVVEGVSQTKKEHPFRGNKELAQIHRERGLAAYEKKDFATALQEHEVAVALDPMNARYHNGLGAAYSGLGRIQESIKEARISIALDPQYDEPYLNISLALSKLNMHSEAVVYAKKALAMGSPSNPHRIPELKLYIKAVENMR